MDLELYDVALGVCLMEGSTVLCLGNKLLQLHTTVEVALGVTLLQLHVTRKRLLITVDATLLQRDVEDAPNVLPLQLHVTWKTLLMLHACNVQVQSQLNWILASHRVAKTSLTRKTTLTKRQR